MVSMMSHDVSWGLMMWCLIMSHVVSWFVVCFMIFCGVSDCLVMSHDSHTVSIMKSSNAQWFLVM